MDLYHTFLDKETVFCGVHGAEFFHILLIECLCKLLDQEAGQYNPINTILGFVLKEII